MTQTNPFYKPNPFKVINYQKFQYPQLSKRIHNGYNHPLYRDSNKTPTHVLQNNWTFNQNNLAKKFDFSKKQISYHYKPTQFQVKMKTSQILQIPNNSNKNHQVLQSRLQNPFFRKNLLIDKKEVINQLQIEIQNCRHKAKSSYIAQKSIYNQLKNSKIQYQSPSLKVDEKIKNLQGLSHVYQSKYINQESPQSLKYSKTPQQTQRIPSFRQYNDKLLDKITVRGIVFYLNQIIQKQ